MLDLTRSSYVSEPAAQCSGKLDDGGRCPWASVVAIGGVSVCAGHVSFAEAEIEAARRKRAADRAKMQATWVHDLRRETLTKPTRVSAVVYYVGDPVTKHVKIGTSTNLGKRIVVLRRRRPLALILATEPGTYQMERHRHGQFHHLRIPNPRDTEWFRKAPELMEHINILRSRHGILSPGLPVRFEWVAPVQGRAA